MLVFGDRTHCVEIRARLDGIREELATTAGLPAGIERHGRLAGAFILAAEMAQGIADRDMESCGHDRATGERDWAMVLCTVLARLLLRSWMDGLHVAIPVQTMSGLRLAGAAGEIPVRQPEGYAFYALYPETYALAARSFGIGPVRVIGLRSIGTGLAAMASAGAGAPQAETLRPVGDPFGRRLSMDRRLADDLAENRDVTFLIADEGPGLSGSSFASVVEFLAGRGVDETRLVCLPSHNGNPGPMASAEWRARWSRVRRVHVSFDTLLLDAASPAHRLENWFRDLAGSAIAPLTDLSGGAWRMVRGMQAPSLAWQERRKFLLRTAQGEFLLKFAGLGAIGAEKFGRARLLAAAGFAPEPFGFRHGFIIERWHGQAQVPDGEGAALVETIGRYLGFRARIFPGGDGADLPALARMASQNIAEALGEDAACRLRLDTTRPVRPIHIDGRMHRWEWLALPDGRMLKADALDHASGHDLIGCQDVAWDIAGAAVEFDLDDNGICRLTSLVGEVSGWPVDPGLVSDCIVTYCAFQLGLWMQGEQQSSPILRYERRLRGLLMP